MTTFDDPVSGHAYLVFDRDGIIEIHTGRIWKDQKTTKREGATYIGYALKGGTTEEIIKQAKENGRG